MDQTLRTLERESSLGDPQSRERLKNGLRRIARSSPDAAVKLDALYREDEAWDELQELRSRCLAYDSWTPTKPEDCYTDEEITATPLFEKIKGSLGAYKDKLFLNVGTSSVVLSLCREIIREAWSVVCGEHYAELQYQNGEFSLFYPVVCSQCNARVNERCTVNGRDRPHPHIVRTNKVGHPVDSRLGRQRFDHSAYAMCIGHGEQASIDLFEEFSTTLYQGQTLETRYGGGYLLHKTGMRSEERNGWFELRVLPGDPDNNICHMFRVELHQYPTNDASLPVIAFPPASGDRGSCVVNETIIEVSSMSELMQCSILSAVQTPSVLFGLGSVVQQLDG